MIWRWKLHFHRILIVSYQKIYFGCRSLICFLVLLFFFRQMFSCVLFLFLICRLYIFHIIMYREFAFKFLPAKPNNFFYQSFLPFTIYYMCAFTASQEKILTKFFFFWIARYILKELFAYFDWSICSVLLYWQK